MLCNEDAHVFEQKLHLVRVGTREIEHQDFRPFVLDEMDAVVHEKTGFRLSALASRGASVGREAERPEPRA